MVVDTEYMEQKRFEENLKNENEILKQELERYKRVAANMHRELKTRKL